MNIQHYLIIILVSFLSVSLDAIAAKPKSIDDADWSNSQKGSLDFLYMLNNSNVAQYFPRGVSRKQINEKYGSSYSVLYDEPTAKPNSDKYDFVKSRTLGGTSESISLISSVTVFYDNNQKVTQASVDHLVSYWDGNGLKQMSEQEARSYLGNIQLSAPPVFAVELEEKESPATSVTKDNLSYRKEKETQTNDSKNLKDNWKLGVIVDEIDGQLKVASLTENMPAIKNGILVGDVILKVNGIDVYDLDKLIKLTRDEPRNLPLSILILRKAKRISIKINPQSKANDYL